MDDESAPGQLRTRMGGERVALHRTAVQHHRALQLVQDVQARQINGS